MGIGLVFFPQFLVKGVAGVDVNPTIIGMLRNYRIARHDWGVNVFLLLQYHILIKGVVQDINQGIKSIKNRQHNHKGHGPGRDSQN